MVTQELLDLVFELVRKDAVDSSVKRTRIRYLKLYDRASIYSHFSLYIVPISNYFDYELHWFVFSKQALCPEVPSYSIQQSQ